MVFKIAVSDYAGFYKGLVGYVVGCLDSADTLAGIASKEIKDFHNNETFITSNGIVPYYGIRQLSYLYDGSPCNTSWDNVWEVFIVIDNSLAVKYEEIIPRRVKKYFDEWLPNNMMNPPKLLGFVATDEFGEVVRDFLSGKSYIKKFGKTMVIPYINIDGVELNESAVINILEEVFDGPVNDYDINDTVADEMVKLGYLGKRYGERQALLYEIKDRNACEALYNFLFSDDDVVVI